MTKYLNLPAEMRKIYYLSTCSTCKRIMSELPLDDFQKQDIKTDPMTEEQLNEMGQLAGSFESLFSRVAMKYKALGLKDMLLTESDYKRHILKEYTFLKRPIFIIDSEIFIGNSKKNVEAVRLKLTQ